MDSLLGGRFRLGRELGRGGFGAVYEAEDVGVPGRLVALKVLERPAHDAASFEARFMREVKNAQRLDHPHAVRIYEYGALPDGRLFYAMELCRGRSLRAVFSGGPAEPARLVRLVREALSALGAAHALGMVHRDVKPDNIQVVAGEDGYEHAKLLDFGLAKVGGGRASQDLTRDGIVFGTVEYMPPEQLAGRPVDARADLYAMSVVLYELLAGRRPFADADERSLVRSILSQAPPDLSTLTGARVPPALAAAIGKGLAKRPEDRHANAEAFSAALSAAVPGSAHQDVGRAVRAAPGGTVATPAVPPTRVAAPALPPTRVAAPTLPPTRVAAPALPPTRAAAPSATVPPTRMGAPAVPETRLAAASPSLPATRDQSAVVVPETRVSRGPTWLPETRAAPTPTPMPVPATRVAGTAQVPPTAVRGVSDEDIPTLKRPRVETGPPGPPSPSLDAAPPTEKAAADNLAALAPTEPLRAPPGGPVPAPPDTSPDIPREAARDAAAGDVAAATPTRGLGPAPGAAEPSFDGSLPLGNRYVLRRQHSASAHGRLFEALDLETGAAVAVKVLEGKGSIPDEDWKRYLRGVEALGRVAHRHVVRLLDAGLTPAGAPYFVLEWVPGAPLERFLARGQVPLPEAAGALCQVLEGLQAAHDAGVVHRDVTVKHILVVPTDEGAVVKLFGFGIAKAVIGADGTVTRYGRAVGTPRSMAPEQLKGQPIDGRADVFSAGIVLFEMLAGRPPYTGESLNEVTRAILFDPPPVLPDDVPAATRAAVGPALARALAKDRKDRFPTARAFRDAIAPLAGRFAAGDFAALEGQAT